MENEQVLKSISEGQELIALFMGLPVNHQYGLEVQMPPDNPSKNGYWTRPKYNESWDWLMPVVKKWNDLVISKRQDKKGWMKWQYKTVMLRTDIEPLFKDLVESIKWYNSLERGGN